MAEIRPDEVSAILKQQITNFKIWGVRIRNAYKKQKAK